MEHSIRTKHDIEAACQILLRNAVDGYKLIGQPKIRLISYALSSADSLDRGTFKYPVWEQQIQITRYGDTDNYRLAFHEIDGSINIWHHYCDFSSSKCKILDEDTPINREFIISPDGQQVETLYLDDGFLATPKRARAQYLEESDDLIWRDIISVEPCIVDGDFATWKITQGFCNPRQVRLLPIFCNPLQEDHCLYLKGNPQKPIVGKDYFAFNWRNLYVRYVTGLMAVRFNGHGFDPIPLSKAQISLPDLVDKEGKKMLTFLK